MKKIRVPTLKQEYRYRSVEDLRRICGPEVVISETQGVAVFGVLTLENATQESERKFQASVKAGAVPVQSASFELGGQSSSSCGSRETKISMHLDSMGGQGTAGLGGFVQAQTLQQAREAIAQYMGSLNSASAVPVEFTTVRIEQLKAEPEPPALDPNQVGRLYDKFLFLHNEQARCEEYSEDWQYYLEIQQQLKNAGIQYLTHPSEESWEGVEQILRDLHLSRKENTGVVAYSGPAPGKFNDLRPLHQAVGLIWSKVASEEMNHAKAQECCKRVGGRLPNEQEFEALIQAMSPGGKYNADLLPGTRGKWFWSSSVVPQDGSQAFLFDGDQGCVCSFDRKAKAWVRRVVEAPRSSEPCPKPKASRSSPVSEHTAWMFYLERDCAQSHCTQHNHPVREQIRNTAGSFILEREELNSGKCPGCGQSKQVRLAFTKCSYHIKYAKNGTHIEKPKERAQETRYVQVQEDWEKVKVTLEPSP